MELYEILEQSNIPETRLKDFWKNLAEKWERDEILKEINNQVNTRVNAFFSFLWEAPWSALVKPLFDKVNDAIRAEVKWTWGIKWKVRQLLADEHYMHYQEWKIVITDDYEWKKSPMLLDLDKKWHRRILWGVLTQLSKPAEFLSSIDESVKTWINTILWAKINELNNIVSYVHDLDQLEQNFDKEVEENEAVTKKQAKALRKVLRKDINLDKKDGEFDELLKDYKNPVVVAAEETRKVEAEIADVTPKITAVWLKDSGYAISWAVKKIDDNTFSSNIEKNNVVINDVKFDKDGNAIAGEYSGADGKAYKIEADNAGKITKVAVVENTPEEVPVTPLPTDYATEPLVDWNPDLVRITALIKPSEGTIIIKDLKVYKSASNKGFKVEWKINDNAFTFYLDDKDKLQVLDWDKLTPAWTNAVEVGNYTFTQGGNNVISVAKKADEEDAVDVPENLSTRTIDQIKKASPEAIVSRLWELIEKLKSDNISYIPWKNWPRTNNPDIAWVQKWLIEYAKKNPEFSIRDSGDRDWRKWSADWTEFKFTWGSAPDWFIEDDFVSWEYDKWFAWSVASFQTFDEIAWKQDWLPWQKTLTALKSALGIEPDGWGW